MINILLAVIKVGASTIFNLLSMVVTGKVLAMLLGPPGFGTYMLLRQLYQNVYLVGTLNGNNALVQGLASREGGDQDRFLGTVFWIYVTGVVTVSSALLVMAPWMAEHILGRSDLAAVALIRWMALPVLMAGGMNYFVSLLNGHRAINRLVLAQACGALATLVGLYPLGQLVRAGWEPAYACLISLPLGTSWIYSMVYCKTMGWIPWSVLRLRPQFHPGPTRDFLKVAMPLLATGFLSTGAQLLISGSVAKWAGLEALGYYSVAWSISMTYVTLVLSSYAAYYLPTLSSCHTAEDKQVLMHHFVDLALLVVPPLIVLMICLKSMLITLQFSNTFLPALKVIRWMLLGDFFKVISWVLAIPMLAFVDMKAFFWSELLFNGLIVLANGLALAQFGNIEWVGIIFFANYVLYFVFCVWYARTKHAFKMDVRQVWLSVRGFLLISAASWCYWNQESVQINKGLLIFVLSLGSAFWGLRPDQRGKLRHWLGKIQARGKI